MNLLYKNEVIYASIHYNLVNKKGIFYNVYFEFSQIKKITEYIL